MVMVLVPEMMLSVPLVLAISTMTVLVTLPDLEFTTMWTLVCLLSAAFAALSKDVVVRLFPDAWAVRGEIATIEVAQRVIGRR